jgi:hypothetical protein
MSLPARQGAPRRGTDSPYRPAQIQKAAPDFITMRKLAPTIHYEGALIAEMAGTVDAFRTVSADVLVLGGSKGLPFLEPARDALARTLPHSRRVEIPGLDHGASSDPGTTNPGGKPERIAQVAREVRFFFATLNTHQETQ